jgi:outer membrane protein assembly factor BamE (lipoprotein component of BamABCDE complex)
VFVDSFNDETKINNTKTHYYIFNTRDISKFDDILIDAYQVTDNQKISLRIDINGNVINKGVKYDYQCFKDFHNNFGILEVQ